MKSFILSIITVPLFYYLISRTNIIKAQSQTQITEGLNDQSSIQQKLQINQNSYDHNQNYLATHQTILLRQYKTLERLNKSLSLYKNIYLSKDFNVFDIKGNIGKLRDKGIRLVSTLTQVIQIIQHYTKQYVPITQFQFYLSESSLTQQQIFSLILKQLKHKINVHQLLTIVNQLTNQQQPNQFIIYLPYIIIKQLNFEIIHNTKARMNGNKIFGVKINQQFIASLIFQQQNLQILEPQTQQNVEKQKSSQTYTQIIQTPLTIQTLPTIQTIVKFQAIQAVKSIEQIQKTYQQIQETYQQKQKTSQQIQKTYQQIQKTYQQIQISRKQQTQIKQQVEVDNQQQQTKQDINQISIQSNEQISISNDKQQQIIKQKQHQFLVIKHEQTQKIKQIKLLQQKPSQQEVHNQSQNVDQNIQNSLQLIQIQQQFVQSSQQIIQESQKVIQESQQIVEESQQIVQVSQQIAHLTQQIVHLPQQILHRSQQIVNKSQQIIEQLNQIVQQLNQIMQEGNQIVQEGNQIVEQIKQIAQQENQSIEPARQIGESVDQIVHQIKSNSIQEQQLIDIKHNQQSIKNSQQTNNQLFNVNQSNQNTNTQTIQLIQNYEQSVLNQQINAIYDVNYNIQQKQDIQLEQVITKNKEQDNIDQSNNPTINVSQTQLSVLTQQNLQNQLNGQTKVQYQQNTQYNPNIKQILDEALPIQNIMDQNVQFKQSVQEKKFQKAGGDLKIYQNQMLVMIKQNMDKSTKKDHQDIIQTQQVYTQQIIEEQLPIKEFAVPQQPRRIMI